MELGVKVVLGKIHYGEQSICCEEVPGPRAE